MLFRSPCVYRPDEELQEWKEKDPIPRFEKKLLEMKVLTPEKCAEIKSAIAAALAEAVRFAEESPVPEPGELLEDVYS